MEPGSLVRQSSIACEEMLGYLNFSSGAADTRFRRNTNELVGRIEAGAAAGEESWRILRDLLGAQLGALRGSSEAFRQIGQAEAVLGLVFDRALPAYREFHRDLLYHQSPAALFRPFFLALVCEAVLDEGPPWEETDRIVEGTLFRLNDFIGYRPVAVLRTPQKIEPYAHEWVRPIPLYLRGAGVGVGKYHDIVEQALAILDATDEDLLAQAWFDPALVEELAVDPRAYDFDHPLNKRPNYQFGQWDPHRLDQQGRYRRFVLQEVTLDALWQRTQAPGQLPAAEILYEAGAVLAGTILMASGTSGAGPDTHDSSTTLATLLPPIAAYRDQFYLRLLAGLAGPHGDRLRAEAAALHQPFGAARQHLNQRLAHLRAVQLQQVHLAQLFARMGFPEAGSREAEVVPVASARMLCGISSLLEAGRQQAERGQLAEASRLVSQIEDRLHRAVECGALVDPWNILGFQGQFSLFRALENSVRDHRVDVLVHLVRQIFGLHARLQAEAAAAGDAPLAAGLSERLAALARWWDQFATLDVKGAESISGAEAVESASHVAAALGAWRASGGTAGDIAFWRRHVARFNSPKTYALVVEALLAQRDFVAAMALLVEWLRRAEEVPLAGGDRSFHQLAVRWLAELATLAGGEAGRPAGAGRAAPERWTLTRKLFDYLEANADDYWEVPRFEWDHEPPGADLGDDPADEEEGLFRAAYEEVTYRDSTSDGYEGETLDAGGPPTDYELDFEAARLGNRLAFLVTLARLWKIAAASGGAAPDPPARERALREWYDRAMANRRGLLELLAMVERHRVPAPAGTHDSRVEYDRRRQLKESLLAQIIAAVLETSDAARLLLAASDTIEPGTDLADWDQQAAGVLRAMLQSDVAAVRTRFPSLLAALERQPILYIPLAKRGAAAKIVAARTVQHLLLVLLRGLARLGLVAEACRLLARAQAMEQHRPVGEGVVTEFDRLFEAGYQAIVETLVDAAGGGPDATKPAAHNGFDAELIDALESLTEALLKRWLAHSRSLRLSVLEKAADSERWETLAGFIQRYGQEIFTPRFLNLGNLRAILHQGVDTYLAGLEQAGEPCDEFRLLADLDVAIPRGVAVEQLALAVEAIVENYAEYKDYNSTTTQSDRGELLYILLDFLRLKTSYERFAWNIRPVFLAHDVLVRNGRTSTAELWRQAVAERTSDVADWHLQRLAELGCRHGVRLATVADRLAERFVQPLALDCLRALIRPAMEEARLGRPPKSFEMLEQELREFTEHPSGSGLNVPGWLVALDEEVDLVRSFEPSSANTADTPAPIPRVRLAWEDVQSQLRSWDAA